MSKALLIGATAPARALLREAEMIQTLARTSDSRSPSDKRAMQLAIAVRSATTSLKVTPTTPQVAAAIALMRGLVVELPTGEGKTLACALAASALATESPVHVATVNDYLAQRDSEWMGPLFQQLEVSTDVVLATSGEDARRRAYKSKVVYSTIQQLGFDVMRDGLRAASSSVRIPELGFLIVDEADSVLLDEARFPLVLSRDGDLTAQDIATATRFVEGLDQNDFEVEFGRNRVWLNDSGIEKAEAAVSDHLFDGGHGSWLHHVQLALRARALYRRDHDYIVRDGAVEVVDEYTGRTVQNRRWSDGLQQALEAKERVPLSKPRSPVAQMTIRGLTQLYRGVCGLTATAHEAESEFRETYGLQVVVLPAVKPAVRIDHPARVSATREETMCELRDLVVTEHRCGRPILVGCCSVRSASEISARLNEVGVPHELLTAANDFAEAVIVARAGRLRAVTVATQLAGRGVDIVLGANESEASLIRSLGGLLVIGTERLESPRHERQLRGRAGRQGDPGETVFLTSAQDRVVAAWLPASDSLPLRDRLEIAQLNLSSRNRDLRTDLWEFDAVYELQRLAAIELREGILRASPQRLIVFDEAWSHHLQRLRHVLDTISFAAWGGETVLSAWRRLSRELFSEFVEGLDMPTPVTSSAPILPDFDVAALGPRRDEDADVIVTASAIAGPLSQQVVGWGAASMMDVLIVADADGADF